MNGFKLAARYSFPPSDLKLCGVKFKNTPEILTKLVRGENLEDSQVRPIFESFEAAFPYYKLIASKNNISDPFDYRVIEAYWIGNELLKKVTTPDIKKLILTDFKGPGLLTDELSHKRADRVPMGALPHHSFHVLILGSVTGRVQFHGNLFDLCCVNTGKIIKLNKETILIKSPKLIFENNRFSYTKPQTKEIEWDNRLLPEVKIGDIVTTHWKRACEIIDEEKQKRIYKYTQTNINAINRGS